MAPTTNCTASPASEPDASVLNAGLICFCVALSVYMFYLLQLDVNAQVEDARLAALPFSLRLAFARVRLQNAKIRLDCLQDSEKWAHYVFYVQKRLVIKQYVEAEAKEPLKALEQAERYRIWWWTGFVNVPASIQHEREDVLEMDGDDDGYWLSDEE